MLIKRYERTVYVNEKMEITKKPEDRKSYIILKSWREYDDRPDLGYTYVRSYSMIKKRNGYAKQGELF